jgi:hypothetical protein
MQARAFVLVFTYYNVCLFSSLYRPECREVLRELEYHPCMKGEAFKWIVFTLKDYIEGLDFLARVQSCPANCGSQSRVVDHEIGPSLATSVNVSHLQIVVLVLLVTFWGII